MIPVVGTLMKSRTSTGGTSTVETRQKIRAASQDSEVSGILLRVDSPGENAGVAASLIARGGGPGRPEPSLGEIAYLREYHLDAAWKSRGTNFASEVTEEGWKGFGEQMDLARDAFEKAYFEYHIAREGGNMSRVADKVGLERTHLYRKLKQLGISLPRRAE